MKRQIDKIWKEVEALLDERVFRPEAGLTRLQKFAHFWVLVSRSFSRNRCPTQASGLAYATMLALIPMLAVVVSITSTFLKDEGEERIDQFIVHLVASVTPPAMMTTNTVSASTNISVNITNVRPVAVEDPVRSSGAGTNDVSTNVVQVVETAAATNQTVLPAFAQAEDAVQARKRVARTINDFIQNTRSGAMGVTGTAVLIFVAISMLVRIEEAFNQIWGVARGRTWFMRIVLYWDVISLAPVLLVVAAALTTGPHLESTRDFLSMMPFISSLVFRLLPAVVLSMTFTLFYLAVPNAKVRWDAAVVGGVVAGVLLHLNNLISVLYVSRVVSNSKIYGSLGLVPVFMIGLYLAWLILLFGAQVAYAYQNRATYFEERQVENINQRGREFIALRLMTLISQRFVRGEPPPSVNSMAEHIGVPSRLVRQLLNTLSTARLVVETSGMESSYVPARPIESITCHDILQALRASQGQELATREGPTRAEVYGEFQRIQEAERKAASSVTMLALVHRAEAQEGRMVEVVSTASLPTSA